MIGSYSRCPDDAVEAAAYWDARLRMPSANEEDRRLFTEWRDSGADNRAAFDEMQAVLGILRNAGSGHPELRAMRDAAVEATSPARRWRRLGAVAAMLVAVVGGAVTFNSLSPTELGGAKSEVASTPLAEHGYATTLGERSTVTLADGSRITLNTDSRVSVALRPDRRDVAVLAGQALFEVAKDKTRPFVVRAGDKTVTALGTTFDIRLRPKGMEVTLIEGRVAVARAVPGLTPSQPVELKPGQQLVSTSGGQALLRKVDVEKETSWREGRVIFDDQTLASAVVEMNRYSPVKIIADPTIAHIRINGMFKAGQQASFARTLEAYLPIEAVSTADEQIELRPRG